MGGMMPTHPLAAVLSELDPTDHLLVDQAGGHWVAGRVVPGAEDLLAEEQPPGGVALLGALLLGVLLTLGHGIHHVVAAAAQRRHLHQHRIYIYIYISYLIYFIDINY